MAEFNERQKVLDEIARRDAEIYEMKKNEALEIGIDADALSNASASTQCTNSTTNSSSLMNAR